MLRASLLLASIVAIVAAAGGRTAQDCTIDDKWTVNYIRFECYQGTGAVVKGVRAIGCVPTNVDSGALIQPGTTHNEQYFTYSCSKSGEFVSYQIINCRDSTGKAMAVNETRKMADGTTFKCYKDSTGAIKLSQEKPGGCIYNGKVYAVGQTWTENVDFKAMVNGVMQTIGKAVAMECKNGGAKGFISQATGCVTTSNTTLSNGGFAKVNSLYIKCSISTSGNVTMSVVNESDVTCTFNGKTVKNGDKYTTPDGIDVYTCIYGVITKTGCVIKDKFYPSNTVVYISGKAYFCNVGAGVVDFGAINGCTLPDGSVQKFMSTWVKGTEVHQCRFTIDGNKVTTWIEIIGCAYDSKTVDRNAIVVVEGKQLKKCSLVGTTWTLRNLTTSEYTAYIESQSTGGSSGVIGGNGGSGAGGSVTATVQPTRPTKPADTTTKPTTTTPKPTTTTQKATTTTPKPTTKPTTTTQKPTTKPSTLITRLQTITTKKPCPTTQKPTTTIRRVTTTIKKQPTTVSRRATPTTKKQCTTKKATTTAKKPTTKKKCDKGK